MKKLDIPALELLVRAIEESSLTKAAAMENLVASAASKRIASLEERVGTALLKRDGRGVKATAAGEMLYRHAKAILRGVQVAEEALGSYSELGQVTVRLVANLSTSVQWMPGLIASFARQHPDISIDLVEDQSKDIPRRVAEGAADIGIYHAPHPSPGVASFPFRKDRIGLVVPQGHPLERRGALRLEDAIDHDFIGYFPLHTLDAFIALVGNTISRPPKVKMQITNVEARCMMVREGLGLAVVPENLVRLYLRPLALSLLRLEDPWAERTFFLCVRDPNSLHPSAALLLRHLRRTPSTGPD